MTTTTPTTALADLDGIEKLADAADQNGQHIYTDARDSNNYKANEAWHRVASPELFRELAALARRAAQPAEVSAQIAKTGGAQHG